MGLGQRKTVVNDDLVHATKVTDHRYALEQRRDRAAAVLSDNVLVAKHPDHQSGAPLPGLLDEIEVAHCDDLESGRQVADCHEIPPNMFAVRRPDSANGSLGRVPARCDSRGNSR